MPSASRHGITLHSDGAQAFGTLPLNPDALGVDLLSLSAHKLYGPKGIGALVLREGIAIEPLQWGGGQEAGLRAGTLPTALIVGFAAAARLALQEAGAAQQPSYSTCAISCGRACSSASPVCCSMGPCSLACPTTSTSACPG